MERCNFVLHVLKLYNDIFFIRLVLNKIFNMGFSVIVCTGSVTWEHPDTRHNSANSDTPSNYDSCHWSFFQKYSMLEVILLDFQCKSVRNRQIKITTNLENLLRWLTISQKTNIKPFKDLNSPMIAYNSKHKKSRVSYVV